VSSAATTAIASAVAEASLVSALEPFGLSAIGSVSATATTTALDARGRAPANSFFELLFQVDATGDVPIAGRVQAANGGAEGDAWASVELVEVVGGATLVSYEAAPGADILFDESVALQANTTYRLTAQSLAYAQASQIVESSTGSASYAIAVPEPSLGIQFIVSCVLVFGLRLRRRWSPRIDRGSTPSQRGPR
jgi:hypothetical protein